MDELSIGGQLLTTGDGVNTLHVDGEIGSLHVDDGIHANGTDSNAVVDASGDVQLDSMEITAADGERILHTD